MTYNNTMRVGIDISQLAYPNTGVANYLESLVRALLEKDKENKYILFFSSARRNLPSNIYDLRSKNVKIKQFKFPPTLLDFIWNKMHVFPIEWFVGYVDVFITSDWTEPPVRRAKKATILYDLLVHKFPEEMHAKIVSTQKKKLSWVKKESDMVFCISESTKNDAEEILGIDKSKLQVIYPGIY